MKRILVDIGHCANGDIGASGIKFEDTCNKDIGFKVVDKLKALGYEVGCTYQIHSTGLSDSLRQRYTQANEGNYDFFVSIHNNCYNGSARGSEVLIASDNSSAKPVAQSVQNELVAMGYFNRGVKVDSRGLAVLQKTKCPAILIECFFIDNVSDCEKYNPERISDAIVKGLVGRYAPSTPIQNTPQASQTNEIPSALQGVVLRKGDHSESVRVLQARLNAIGFDCGVADGIFGNKTEAAVKAFQTSRKLGVDGIVGKVTVHCLYF